MRHVTRITSPHAPQKAALDNHPGILDSLSAFFSDPLGVLGLHFNKGES